MKRSWVYIFKTSLDLPQRVKFPKLRVTGGGGNTSEKKMEIRLTENNFFLIKKKSYTILESLDFDFGDNGELLDRIVIDSDLSY